MDLLDASDKIPGDTPGIDPGTFWLVAQRLNHYATIHLRVQLLNYMMPHPRSTNYVLHTAWNLQNIKNSTSWKKLQHMHCSTVNTLYLEGTINE
jgi:hypothetical protein